MALSQMSDVPLHQRFVILRNLTHLVAGCSFERTLDNGQIVRVFIAGDALTQYFGLQEYLTMTLQILRQCIDEAPGDDEALWKAESQHRLVFCEAAHVIALTKCFNAVDGEGLDTWSEIYLTLLHKFHLHLLYFAGYVLQVASRGSTTRSAILQCCCLYE